MEHNFFDLIPTHLPGGFFVYRGEQLAGGRFGIHALRPGVFCQQLGDVRAILSMRKK